MQIDIGAVPPVSAPSVHIFPFSGSVRLDTIRVIPYSIRRRAPIILIPPQVQYLLIIRTEWLIHGDKSGHLPDRRKEPASILRGRFHKGVSADFLKRMMTDLQGGSFPNTLPCILFFYIFPICQAIIVTPLISYITKVVF